MRPNRGACVKAKAGLQDPAFVLAAWAWQMDSRALMVFLWWAGVRSRKQCEWADESSQSIAGCGNGWSKYLSFQMKR